MARLCIINAHIEDDWSPEQVAGRLKKEGIISLHHETSYQHILVDKKAGGELYSLHSAPINSELGIL